jgi:hypothetical protein
MSREEYDRESYIAGASASLNRSIADVDRLASVSDRSPRAGKLREKFRKRIRAELLEVAFDWYLIGFKRGHKTCRRLFTKTGKIPKKISRKTRGTIRGQEFRIKLHSEL